MLTKEIVERAEAARDALSQAFYTVEKLYDAIDESGEVSKSRLSSLGDIRNHIDQGKLELERLFA